ncbi:hypothetical protein JOL79_11745 [Microbispora sp. RL4-1S]|uniref:LamG domain-containing protein n=1 Tax=Microbispora oryzae TaxID=2806554 RepID=A0A941AJ19_9ACTN|nr:hypothetical protein [Microbispora oryzae]MBP2704487.1 hypothetical protein [Microbispora oryzae]
MSVIAESALDYLFKPGYGGATNFTSGAESSHAHARGDLNCDHGYERWLMEGYVSLKSTDNRDYSTIIETMDATVAQTLNFTVTGGLSTGQVHVWSTNLNSNNTADFMVHAADAGAWSILRNSTSCAFTTIASGTTTVLGTNRWHALALGFSGSSITATIDGTAVRTVTDSAFGAGQVGYGTSQDETAQFDNLKVVAGSGGTGWTTAPLRQKWSRS